MEKHKIRKRIFLILMVLWMAGIFLFSSRTGNESAADSGRMGRLAGELFVPGFEDWSPDAQDAFAARIDHPVRKAAHASEYALLAVLASGVYLPGKRRISSVYPWLTASIYAATDEFHQLFVPGRSGQISDVILDSTGALAGTLAVFLVLKAWKKIKNRVYSNFSIDIMK